MNGPTAEVAAPQPVLTRRLNKAVAAAEYRTVRPDGHAEKKLRTASRMGRMAFLLVH
ncbi:hypothetical protein ACH4E9_04540 [Streptomyces anulatus]